MGKKSSKAAGVAADQSETETEKTRAQEWLAKAQEEFARTPAPAPFTIETLENHAKRIRAGMVRDGGAGIVNSFVAYSARSSVEHLANIARGIDGVSPPPRVPILTEETPRRVVMQEAMNWIDSLLEWCVRERRRPLDTNNTQPGGGKLTPSDLAHKYDVPLAPLRKRLDRWRYEHDTGYSEVHNPKRNEPRYLYDESAVMPVIDALKANAAGRKRATDGQQKKL